MRASVRGNGETMRITAPIGKTALVVSFAILSAVAGEDGSPRPRPGSVELVRDRWGVPHVFADSDAGAMYGLGWAQAEDRAFQMYLSSYIMQGRAAELLGDVRKANGRETAAQQDAKMRTMGWYRAARRAIDRLDPDTRALLEAFARGVNDYVSGHRERLVYLFRTTGMTPEPWTPADSIACWWHLAQFFAGDGLGDLRAAQPPVRAGARPRAARIVDDEAAVVQRGDVSDAWLREVDAFMNAHGLRPIPTAPAEPPKFSHAWVVGGRKSGTGAAVLVSDPQTPVRNPSLFHEFHFSGRSFNARGIGVAGSPVVLIGFTRDLAWGVTALGADQADLFILKTDPARPNQYYFDGQWREMSLRTETIRIRDGVSSEILIRESHLGPLVTQFAQGARAGEEVALKRVPICDVERETLQASLKMIRARNVRDFGTALADWRIPTANAICGDRNGDIGYWAIGALPVRPAQSGDGGAAIDGSSSASDWQGYVPFRLVPQVINPAEGFILSGNHRPIASFYTIPFGISTGSGGDSLRSRRLRERLKAPARLAPNAVLDIHYDSVNPAKRDVVRFGLHLRDTLGEQLAPESLKALGHLEEWFRSGARSDISVPGTELANLMPVMFREGNAEAALRYGGGEAGLCYFQKTVSRRLDADAKAPLAADEKSFVDQTLTAAWRAAERRYGPDSGRWHSMALDELRKQRLPYFVSLDGFPSVDAANDLPMPALSCTDGGTILSQLAQSYTQWVPMHDVDSAKSLLPIGQSENPESLFWKSNLDSWARGELHPAPLSRGAVRRLATATVRLPAK
jgi:penicillin amidase